MATQDSLRKVLGAIKDSTKVGLAQINSEYKDLDIAIVKATNHVESPPKEKHMRTIFAATSASRPRADVAYCIHALTRRISKTHNWAVALKSLLVIHRSLREGDPTFREELINYSRSRRLAFNLSNFRDDSSPAAWDYSSWVRSYALYLEERLECFRILKYDLDSNHFLRIKELDTVDLLEHMPVLQELLYRLMSCQPEGAAYSNYLIQYALALVLKESIRIYQAINDGLINLVDKFFEMQRFDAIKALEIYKRGSQQTERLSEFYDACKGLDFSRSMKFPPLEQPPQSFLTSMEQYVRDAPQRSSSFARKDSLDRDGQGKKVLSLEYKPAEPEEPLPPPAPPAPIETSTPIPDPIPATTQEKVDFLGLDNVRGDASVLEESNALALAVVPASNGTTVENGRALDIEAGATGWELAIVTAASSNDSALNQSKLAGGLDRLTLDGLYDDALNRQAYAAAASNGVNYMAPNPFAGNEMVLAGQQQDPFLASNKVAPPSNVQLAVLAQQQQAIMMQQQQVMMMQQQMMGGAQPTNPYSYGMPYMTPSPNQYQGHTQTNPFGNPGLL